jgi:Ca2+-binding EF-hand superfamily protein
MSEDRLEREVAEGIKTFDLNGDGSLQFEEFLRMLKFLVEEKGIEI